MHASVTPIAEILTINDHFYEKSFEKLDDEMARTQFAPDTSTITWLLAHLATARFQMGEIIGIKKGIPWDGMFTHGIEQIDHDNIPTLPEIKDCWGDISQSVMSRMPELTDSDLAAEPARRFPTSEQTVLAALAFMAQHEVYHLGQLSYIRRLLKEPGLFKLLFLR